MSIEKGAISDDMGDKPSVDKLFAHPSHRWVAIVGCLRLLLKRERILFGSIGSKPINRLGVDYRTKKGGLTALYDLQVVGSRAIYTTSHTSDR